MKGATGKSGWFEKPNTDFNPRTREGCDQKWYNIVIHLDISIHAPVKGATMSNSSQSEPKDISIHAPVKGATLANLDIKRIKGNFNPRTREGCDEKI